MIRRISVIAALLFSTSAWGQTPLLPENEIYESLRNEAMETVRAQADAGNAGAAFALARGLLADVLDQDAVTQGAGYLQIAADAGIVEAQVQYAGMLRRGGGGGPPDAESALDYLEKAAETGDAEAILTLGAFVLDTQLGATGRDRALELLQDAAGAGDIDAANQLGALYAQGRGVPLDPDRALEYFGMGLVVGNTPAMVSMGDLYRTGSFGFPPDTEKAMALYTQAGLLGNAGASRRVADMHLNGEGVPASADTAVAMLEDQALKGDQQAYLTLADYFLRGDVIPYDLTTAMSYLEKAVDAGNTVALIRMGDLYRTGAPNLLPDPNKALEFYNRAVEVGAPGAERYVANLYLDLTQPLANPTRGIDLLRVAAAKGDATAAISLGDLYSVNDLVQANYETAKGYFEMALGFGNANAVIDFAQALVSGPLAARHRDEALTLLTGAVESGLPGASAELARLQLAGTFPGRGLEGVLSMLLESTRNGDAAAARYLLQLYREGYGLVLSPDRDAAENLLATLEPLLGPEGVAVERILLEAPGGPENATLVAIYEQFSKLSRPSGVQVLRQLKNLNANAYVYIMQTHLRDRSIYTGPLHGLLDTRTIGAMRTACAEVGATSICDAGPLTDGAVQVLGNYLFDPPVENPSTQS